MAGINLANYGLIHDDLRECELYGTSLAEVDLRMAPFNNTDMRGVILRGANLSNAVLRSAKLGKVALDGVILDGVELRRRGGLNGQQPGPSHRSLAGP